MDNWTNYNMAMSVDLVDAIQKNNNEDLTDKEIKAFESILDKDLSIEVLNCYPELNTFCSYSGEFKKCRAVSVG